MRYGFKAGGGVVLTAAKIDGDLDCAGGQFTGNPDAPALSANDVEVKGNVFLNNGFKAEGGVLLSGSKLDKNLDCDGGQFIGSAERARS